MRATILSIPLLLCAGAAGAQAPGEDPVQLNRRMTLQMVPLGTGPGSSAPNLQDSQPDWQRARSSRYQAKSWAADPGSVMTERDVINTVNTEGLKTACVQSVGSTVVPRGTTLRANEQVVVLRGDLVNICN